MSDMTFTNTPDIDDAACVASLASALDTVAEQCEALDARLKRSGGWTKALCVENFGYSSTVVEILTRDLRRQRALESAMRKLTPEEREAMQQ
jgi:hypothetical protein